MRKVLLVTLQGDNLGNRLQNYALQEVLKSLGCKVYTPYAYLNEIDSVKKRLKFSIKAFLGKIGIKKYKSFYHRRKRITKFAEFNSKYINNMIKIDYSATFDKSWEDYDFAVSGSDQVWHGWSKNSDELRFFYLEFIEKSKRISYAPSFGFEAFPIHSVEIHKKGLSGINCLSCRENKGIELIRKLVKREAQKVLDPTLLLEKEDWIKLEKKPEWYNGNKYLLTYFLGDNCYMREIEQFSNDNGIQIIEAYDRTSLYSSLITPDEFIWLIRHAEYVCTDSFHATVFSIAFNKLFLSFRRKGEGMEKMFDRIEDLLDLFEISDRVYEGKIEAILATYNTKDISSLKEESIAFLEKSLNVEYE